jgi:arylsulfatase A-like enzyme
MPAKAAPRNAERPVYSLIDNRLSAHLRHAGGLVVAAGSAGFAKYMRIGNELAGKKRSWEMRHVDNDIRVARMTGKSANVYVPLTASAVARSTLRLRALAPADMTMSVRVNDHKNINVNLAKGWSTAELAVPPGQLKEGENVLSLFVSSSGFDLAWLQIGGESPPPDAGIRFFDPTANSLLIAGGAGMSWYVSIPERAKLAGDLSAGCTLAVAATADDGQAVEGRLVGTGSAVDLAPLAGKAVRLDLDVVGCATAQLSNVSLMVPGELPALKRGEPPKYVVFVIMDSLRADRVRAFQPKARAETPIWDKLADSSAVFLNTYVQGNESQVSHASMWTSAYLAKHRAAAMKDKLPAAWTTIDEIAKSAGKFVAGATGNGYIRPARGFGTAWDQFVNHIEKGLGLKGADIVDKGLSFLSKNRTQPWFLYLGLIDTHVTWRAKQPWLERYDGDYKGRFQTEYGDEGPRGSNGKGLTEREQQHVRALYDSNVSYQDDLLGTLIETLKAWNVWDQTMLVVTADHGDEQWEDGRVGHGGSARETLLHVPLLIYYPPVVPARKVSEGVETIDILPTIADLLGVTTDPEWQGHTLLPLAMGRGGYPSMSFSSQYENSHAGRIGAWKVKLMATGAPRAYNLAADPDERRDLYGEPGGAIGTRLVLDPLWILRQRNAEWKKAQWGNAANVSSRFASDLGE